ncbi:hypothetical protein CCHL11_07050, partial [Colletotrichum chlorophyti]
TLPREIRNAIYHFSLTCADCVDICASSKHPAREMLVWSPGFWWKNMGVRQSFSRWCKKTKWKDYKHFGALARTCRKTHAEGSAIFYSNALKITNMEVLAIWLGDIGPATEPISKISGFTNTIWYPYGEPPTIASRRILPECLEIVPALSHSKCDTAVIRTNWTRLLSFKHLPPRFSDDRGWVVDVRQLAEIIYSDFHSIITRALSRGSDLDEACGIILIDPDYYRSYRVPISLDAPCPEQVCFEANAAFIAHLKALLDRTSDTAGIIQQWTPDCGHVREFIWGYKSRLPRPEERAGTQTDKLTN